MDFDTIVLGSGSGGIIAHESNRLGLKTAIIDPGPFGGTCVNRGCIPSKLLIYPADVFDLMQKSSRLNLEFSNNSKWQPARLIDRLNAYTSTTSQKIFEEYEGMKNTTVFNEPAYFIGNKTIQCGTQTLKGNRIYIAVGARPHIPSIKGIENIPVLLADDVFHMKKYPKTLVIIGGGYVAAELSHYFHAHHVDMTIITQGPYLSKLDPSMRHVLKNAAKKRVKLVENEEIKELAKGSNGVVVTTNHKTIEAERILVATGLQPQTENLGLKNTSITCDEDGYIEVDPFLQAADHVYAFGDCIAQAHFRHTANYQGEYLKKSLKATLTTPFSFPYIPYALFTHPQLAAAGPNEQQLSRKNIPYYSGETQFSQGALAKIRQMDTGLVKLYFHRDDDTLLSGHIVGEEASTLIHTVIAYLQMGAKRKDILDSIFIHPTMGELISSAAHAAKK